MYCYLAAVQPIVTIRVEARTALIGCVGVARLVIQHQVGLIGCHDAVLAFQRHHSLIVLRLLEAEDVIYLIRPIGVVIVMAGEELGGFFGFIDSFNLVRFISWYNSW